MCMCKANVHGGRLIQIDVTELIKSKYEVNETLMSN